MPNKTSNARKSDDESRLPKLPNDLYDEWGKLLSKAETPTAGNYVCDSADHYTYFPTKASLDEHNKTCHETELDELNESIHAAYIALMSNMSDASKSAVEELVAASELYGIAETLSGSTDIPKTAKSAIQKAKEHLTWLTELESTR